MILNKRKHLLNLLKSIPIFEGLSDKTYKLIMPLLVPIVFPPETRVLEQGEEGDSMYIIKKGAVTVSRVKDGKEFVVLGTLEAGSFFGELSLIDNLPRSANVTTLEKTEVFRLSRHDFNKLISQDKDIAITFYKNCLKESFSRFRDVVSNFTFSQYNLTEKEESLQRIQEDLSLAEKIQRYYINSDQLDKKTSLIDTIRHSYVYKPSIAVGGDYLDVNVFDEMTMGIIIADVEGHGITASMATGVLKSTASIIFEQLGKKPDRFIRYMNRKFIDIIAELHATCCYVLLDMNAGAVTMASAGNIYPMIWKASRGDFLDVKVAGMGLGLDRQAEYEKISVKVERGDRIIFSTNGYISQKDPSGNAYGRERLEKRAGELISSGAENIVDLLYEDLKDFVHGEYFDDDITMLLLEI